ncbi:DinB family protein [Kordia sp.]|uniref:DinB family protein n=1 Tax=Kordia sp. TaxID=1965332 RepID=UPI003D6B677D
MNFLNFFSRKHTMCFLIIGFLTINNLYSQDQKWTLFAKSIKMTTDVKLKFKLTASMKTVTDDQSAWSGIWVRVDNNNEEYGFVDNMGNRPVLSDEWKTYEINGFIDKNTESINFGGLCVYNGKFYFDNIKLYVENKNSKELEEIELENYDFEKEIVDGKVPGWDYNGPNLYNPVNDKYNFKLVKDDPSKNRSLCITGKNIELDKTNIIGEREDYTLQVGTLVSMLNNLSSRVENAVKYLDQRELDHLHDEKANSIGALIMHLAAAEKYYQLYTFENRGFNEEEEKYWGPALNLDDAGRETYKGHDVEHYLKIYKEVRAKTLEELKKRDDNWLAEIRPGTSDNNHSHWFHVMEHQSSHLGQILFLKKRIPPEPNIQLEKKKKID